MYYLGMFWLRFQLSHHGTNTISKAQWVIKWMFFRLVSSILHFSSLIISHAFENRDCIVESMGGVQNIGSLNLWSQYAQVCMNFVEISLLNACLLIEYCASNWAKTFDCFQVISFALSIHFIWSLRYYKSTT